MKSLDLKPDFVTVESLTVFMMVMVMVMVMVERE